MDTDHVEIDDEAFVETVQRGARARPDRSGRHSPSRERDVDPLHRPPCDFPRAPATPASP